MGVDELAVVVDLAGEVRVVLVGRLEDDLGWVVGLGGAVTGGTGCRYVTHLGAIGELVGGQVDLAKRALADQAAQGVVSDRLEVLVREFAVRGSVSVGRGELGELGPYSRSSWYECASCGRGRGSAENHDEQRDSQGSEGQDAPWPSARGLRPCPSSTASLHRGRTGPGGHPRGGRSVGVNRRARAGMAWAGRGGAGGDGEWWDARECRALGETGGSFAWKSGRKGRGFGFGRVDDSYRGSRRGAWI